MKDNSEIQQTPDGFALLIRMEWGNPPMRREEVIKLGQCSMVDAEAALQAVRQMVEKEYG